MDIPLSFAISCNWLFKWFTMSSSDMYGVTLGNISFGLITNTILKNNRTYLHFSDRAKPRDRFINFFNEIHTLVAGDTKLLLQEQLQQFLPLVQTQQLLVYLQRKAADIICFEKLFSQLITERIDSYFQSPNYTRQSALSSE